jgi:hypothetical protein
MYTILMPGAGGFRSLPPATGAARTTEWSLRAMEKVCSVSVATADDDLYPVWVVLATTGRHLQNYSHVLPTMHDEATSPVAERILPRA